MIRWLIFITLGVLIFGSFYTMLHHRPQNVADCQSVQVTTPNSSKITSELATSQEEWQRGLMERDHLDAQAGMLFLFPKADIYPFWMKNTLIPLDIIWLKDRKVVEIASLEAQKGDSIPEHRPTHEANAVLEINRGSAANLGITVGSQLTWKDCT